MFPPRHFFLPLAAVAFFAALVPFSAAHAAPTPAPTIAPTLELETKISYQQGQFGALYDRCAKADERAVIGGSLAAWRQETFRGYSGAEAERAAVLAAFDQAARDVAADPSACHDWIRQAAATWHSIVYLASYGFPVASSR